MTTQVTVEFDSHAKAEEFFMAVLYGIKYGKGECDGVLVNPAPDHPTPPHDYDLLSTVKHVKISTD